VVEAILAALCPTTKIPGEDGSLSSSYPGESPPLIRPHNIGVINREPADIIPFQSLLMERDQGFLPELV
jgi:hypothetical protein